MVKQAAALGPNDLIVPPRQLNSIVMKLKTDLLCSISE
jgi:hypothetical protein